MVGDPYEYDVAVSFSGAQRDYVEQFVEACRRLGLRVFYDRDKTEQYWGRNYIVEFRRVYGGSVARFVVPFLSAEYLATPYPRDEFEAAVEQAMRRNGADYLLPVVFGAVDVPPELLNPAIGVLRADDHTPAQLAETTAQQVERARSTTQPAIEGRRPRQGAHLAPHRTARRRRPIVTAAALVAVLVAGVVAVVLNGGLPSRDASAASGPTATTGAPSPVACFRQDVNAPIKPGPDSGAGRPHLTEVTFSLDEPQHGEVFAEIAGRVQGSPTSGNQLWLLGTADPATHDSSPQPVYGSTQLHIVKQVKPDADGCWSMTRRSIGYSCAGGLTFSYYLASLPAPEAAEMDRLEHKRGQDGFPPREIQDDRGIPLTSTFDIPTEPDC